MNILMILERTFPPDERVEKEAVSLTEAGHNLFLACFSDKKETEIIEYKNFILFKYPISKLLYKSSAACLILPFYFRYWKKIIKNITDKNQIEAIHIHDLPLSKVGYYFKEKKGLKLICDQHEYYSNWIVHTVHYNKGIGKIINKLSNWKKYEKKYLHKADMVITVERPLKENYLKEVKLKNEKIIVVPNTPKLKSFKLAEGGNEIIKRYQDHFTLFYAGGIDVMRGLDLVIKALPELKDEIPEIKFLVGGKMSGGYNPLILANKLNVADYVEFVGWIELKDLPSYIAASKIGLFTPPVNRDEINKTIATKIYQYISSGKPVIVSQAKMMKDFVEKNNCGKAIHNEKDFAEVIVQLYKNKNLYHELSENAKKIAGMYDWDETVKTLIQFYKRL